MRHKFGLTEVAQAGVLAALVCASSFLRFTIPSPVGQTAFHLGNVLCVLSGLIAGPWAGGLAAGVGSALFDLIYPGYAASAPFTLVFKFCIGFLAGLVAFSGGKRGSDWRRNLAGGILGSLAYVALYLTRTYLVAVYVNLMTPSAALLLLPLKAGTSLTNAAIAVAIATPLAPVVLYPLKKAHLRE